MLKLLSNAAVFAGSQGITPVETEKANNPFWLLERLNRPIQQNPIEASVMPANVFVVLEEGVHEPPPLIRYQQDTAAHSRCSSSVGRYGISRAKPLAVSTIVAKIGGKP
jgi:hypothetical protein